MLTKADIDVKHIIVTTKQNYIAKIDNNCSTTDIM